MRFRCPALFAFIVALSAVIPTRLESQATILVDPSDPVYRDLDRLAREGLLDRMIVGQRPYSRSEIVAMASAAQRTLAALQRHHADGQAVVAPSSAERLSFLAELAQSVRARFAAESSISGAGDQRTISLQPLRSISADLTRVTTPTRTIPEGNGLGKIDALLNPMISNRRGRLLAAGSTMVIGMEHLLESRHLAVFAVPELYLIPGAERGKVAGRFQEIQLRLVVKNFSLDIGRENLLWAQGRDVGLLLSNNAPPLDLVRISNERLLTLPWFLGRLGPTKLSLFYADLGAAQNFPHPYLVAYKISVAPSRQLELGASIFTKSGGRGSPRASFSSRILDLLPFLDAGNYANVIGVRGKFETSDHYAGVDGRLRWPAARGAELFWELLLNDFDIRRLGSVLWEDAGHVIGFTLPRFDDAGRVTASVEYHHTGIRYYEHEQFVSGQTLRRTVLGDPLGPDAHGAYVNVDWYRTGERRLALEAAYERRSNDQYDFLPVALPAFGFRRVEVRPKELRLRAIGTWRVLSAPGALGLLVQGGIERTRNFNFVSHDGRTGFLGRVGLEYRLPQ